MVPRYRAAWKPAEYTADRPPMGIASNVLFMSMLGKRLSDGEEAESDRYRSVPPGLTVSSVAGLADGLVDGCRDL